MSENRAKFYLAQLVEIIGTLHELGIVVRDLKPDNILIDQNGYIKLSDLGLSKKGVQGNRLTYIICKTPEYLAPEIITNKDHEENVDYWSIGVILYFMVTGNSPFFNRNSQQMFKNILNSPIEMDPQFSSSLNDLIAILLQRNLNFRFESVNRIKKHQFFGEINWDKLVQKKYEAPFIPMNHRVQMNY